MTPYIAPGLKTKVHINPVLQQQRIIASFSDLCGMPVQDILKRSREKERVEARQILIYLLKQNTAMSLKKIGDIFGYDHTTVIHHVQQVKNLMQTEEKYREKVLFYAMNI
jgi:chromosomal replication initiation ATPase DnaA